MRKQARSVDAKLRYYTEDVGGGVEVQFFHDGDFMYGRRWPTRELAIREADEKRQELERAGWILRW